MASQKDTSLKKAQLFVDSLREGGIDVAEAYVFGSVIKGSDDKEPFVINPLYMVARNGQYRKTWRRTFLPATTYRSASTA